MASETTSAAALPTAATYTPPSLPPRGGRRLRVLVTGGAGFIGSHTCEALLRRGDVVVSVDELNDYYNPAVKRSNVAHLRSLAAQLAAAEPGGGGDGGGGGGGDAADTPRFVAYEGDICNGDLMRTIFTTHKFDVVCHLAARAGVRPSLENPQLYVRSNIVGTVELLELSRTHGVANFVYASSSSVYGANNKVPFAEEDPVNVPVSQYAATKRSCELLAATYSHLYQLPTTGLRFFTVYGPRGRPDMAPYMFVDSVFSGRTIKQFGDGSSSRDYTFVDDIVSGVVASIDRPHACEVFNLGKGSTITLSEFIQLIESLVGKKAVIQQVPEQPGDVPRTYADISKAQRMLGYDPKTTIQAGMAITVRWFVEAAAAAAGAAAATATSS